MTQSLYILNGPNLNMLGRRETDIYGDVTLEAIARSCTRRAGTHGFDVAFHQSNDEGELVDLIHEAGAKGAGIVLNAGAYTHTSVALLDALRAVDLPTVEVHLSNIFRREEFRRHSFVSQAAVGVISGLGPIGYELAIDALAAHIGIASA